MEPGFRMLPAMLLLSALALGRTVAAELDEAPAPTTQPKSKLQRAYPVVQVLDARTVVVRMADKDATLRLAGVRLIRKLDPARSPALAQRAVEFLDNLLKGERVYVVFDDAHDGENTPAAKPAYLYRYPCELPVNLEMIRQGYAQSTVVVPDKYLREYRYYEQRARRIGKGLWPAASDAGPPAPASQPVSASPKATVKDDVVFITRSGSKYHRKDCSFAGSRAEPLSRALAQQRQLSPCKMCKPDDSL